MTYPRGAIAVTVRVGDGNALRFVSTHFQHNVAEDRLAEAKAINRHFGNDPAIPTILAGDMNALPTAQPIQELLKRWSNAADESLLPTAPARKPTSRIDYIFYRPASAFRLRHADVIPDSAASDHRPVFAVFDLHSR